jgi:hypothetical protein
VVGNVPNITVLSYSDKLDVGLIGDREQMADVGRLVGDLHEAARRARRRVAVASRGGRPSVNIDTPRRVLAAYEAR